MSYQIGKKLEENAVKVVVNKYGDFIYLYPNSASFPTKYINLLKWAEEAEKKYTAIAEEKKKQYEGREVIRQDEDGNVEIDVEQLSDLVKVETSLYAEYEEKINELFGQDVLKKYFRECYESDPNGFIPDQECINDFLEEITPVLNDVYNTRFNRIQKRYNKNRRGKNTEKVVPIEQKEEITESK